VTGPVLRPSGSGVVPLPGERSRLARAAAAVRAATEDIAPVSTMPPHVLLGLQHGMTASAAAEQMAALAAVAPAVAESAAAQLAVTALRLIAEGHDDPARLAGHTLQVLAPAGREWA
jgi:hypothetical protein